MSVRKLTYAPGLDGVRALAVVAVMVYHLGTTGLTIGSGGRLPAPGGFLGVDVFFVLSGFLITSLLLGEVAGTGRISIRDFYIRRARRLMPALYTLLVVVSVVAAFAFPAYTANLGGDLVAALTYVTNWWLIAGKTSYFGAGVHPPLLTHLWSLAVEEQFYLLWPLALIWLSRRKRRSTVIGFTSVAIVASTVLAAVLYNPFGDPSRVYFGTDTRLATPMLGALLAVLVRPWRKQFDVQTRAQRISLDVAGTVAAALLGVALFTLNDQSELLYRGGFLAIAIVAAVLVLAASRNDSMVGRALGVPPLRWLGQRSYAIYLWHWPIFAVTQPGVNVSLNPVADTVLRIGSTLVIAELSYRLVERPMRSGALGRAIKQWRTSAGRQRRYGSTVIAGIVLVLIGGVGIVSTQLSSASASTGAPVGPGPDTQLGALAMPSAAPISTASPAPSASASPTPSSSARPSEKPKPTPSLTKASTVPSVAIFGDSQGMTLLINKPANTGKYIAFTDDTIEGCGILLGKIASSDGERRDLNADCHNWLSTWKSRAKRDKPDIGMIMIGAWEVFNIQVTGGATLTFGTSAWDANFTTALDSGISAIHSSGAQVALALLPCYRPIHASAGYWPERGDDTRTRHVNTLLTAAAKAHPTYVTTIAPPHQFCDDPKIESNLSYRWDGVHYYKPGALLYLTAVIPELLAILKP
jgi:peptidoglycan/LPS O-acetylase OafA/YrhL